MSSNLITATIKKQNKTMNKYIIINSETIQKRIEELEKSNILKQWRKDNETRNGHSSQQREAKEKIDLELNTLKQILSNSKPLEEELSKAFSAGMSYGIEQSIDYEKESPQPDLKTYINNLKLDI